MANSISRSNRVCSSNLPCPIETPFRTNRVRSTNQPYWIVAISFLFLVSVHAQLPVADFPADRKEPVNFATEVYPFLKNNCLACHNSTKAKADLILESPADMLRGGDTGPAIVPGNGNDSFLFSTAAHIEEPTMPPANNKSKAKNLTPDQLALLKKWIDEGAKGGAVAAPAPENWTRLSGTQPIYTSDLTGDGRYAAVGRGQDLHIYDLRLQKQVATLIDPAITDYKTAHHDFVQTIEFSPNGNQLASGGFRIAKIWERSASKAGSIVALPGEPTALAVSNDRKWAAVGNADGSILFVPLDVDKAQPVTVKDHGAAITGLSFLPSNDGLVSVSVDKSMRVRKFANPKESVETKLPAEPKTIVVVDGGKQIAVGFADKQIRLFPVNKPAPAPAPAAEPAKPETPKPATPPAATPPVAAPPAAAAAAAKAITLAAIPTAMALAKADGSEYLVASDDGKVTHFKTADGSQIRQLTHAGPIHHLTVAPDFSTVAVSGNTEGSPIRVFNLADGKQLVEIAPDPLSQPLLDYLGRESAIATRLKAHWDKKIPTAEKSSKDEMTKASEAAEAIAKARRDIAAKDAALVKLNAALPKPDEATLTKAIDELTAARRTLSGAERNRDLSVRLAGNALADQAGAAAASKEAETLITALTAEADVIRKAAPESVKKIKTAGLAYSPDGSTLAQVLPDGTVRLFSGKSGAWLENFPTAGEVQFVAFAATDKVLLTARNDKNLIAWSVPGASWTLAKTLGDGKSTELFIDRVTALAYNPDGSKLITGTGVPSRNGQLKSFNTSDWSVWATNDKAHEDTLTAFAFSPFGKKVATASTDKMVKVFDADTLEYESTFEGHTSHVLDVDWNTDGLTLATSGADLQVKIWDIAEGQQLKKVEGYTKEITSIEFVGGTDTTLTASGDKAVKLANAPLPEAGDTFLHTASSNLDGSVIIAGGQDGVLRVWDGKAKKLLHNFPTPTNESVAAAK